MKGHGARITFPQVTWLWVCLMFMLLTLKETKTFF